MDRGVRLLCTLDCTREYLADTYFAHGETRVVESSAGRYREADAKPMSRFGYRFRLERIGKPHVAVIRYPDDKRRYMCIHDGTTYDLTTGVFTGWAQPLTGTMQEVRQVFWPRWKDCSIVFMTWGEGEPAAVASIEIWELAGLPALEVRPNTPDGPSRELGVQYEDPCGTGGAEGAMNHDEWLERVAHYMKHTGQTLLTYPMAWYHGPLYPSACEPAGALQLVVTRDRKQNARWTTQPADWYAALLRRFEREGLRFCGALTLMRLGTLLENMNVDLEAIQGGAETYNNMLWNNQVQACTNDWTPLYNARNLTRIAEILKTQPTVEPYGRVLPEFAYGEKPDRAYPVGPMFNPLHPKVQETVLRFVGEISSRYAKFPAFTGISFNMFASAMPWFASIRSGYDDYTVCLFEEETGIAVRIDAKVPDRFSRRFEFLTHVCKPAWVAWRCRKIREFFGRIRQRLAESRSDLRVTITLWDETLVPAVLGNVSAAHQLFARPSMLELCREGGIDPELYRDQEGLEIDGAMGNPRDRGGHGPHPMGGITSALDETTMYRDFDFLDRDTLRAYSDLPKPGAFIFNCWVEAWGRHVWSRPEADDPNLSALRDMDGAAAEGILRINSEYPSDGFWWDSQSRITPAFPGGVHFLEPYAHAVAELDACRITRGGLFLDKAHTGAIRQFARAYCVLPREKFVTVGDTTDPAAVRTLVRGNTRYFYTVNRDYYPLQVQLNFSGPPFRLRDLAVDLSVDAPAVWSFELGPYELRSFAVSATTDIVSFAATPPTEFVTTLGRETSEALQAIASLRQQGKFIPGMDQIESALRSALSEGRYAWLRRALSSYIIRKARSLILT